MRQFTCRFPDGPSFLNQVRQRRQGPRRQTSLAFLGDAGLHPGDVVCLDLSIAQGMEHHRLHVEIQSRTPRLGDASRGVRWLYTATPMAEDKPWFDMLVQKYSTAERVYSVGG